MFLAIHRHRTRPLVALVLATTALASTAQGASGRAAAPTKSQIRTAITRAVHSRNLWATVNICNTAHHPDVVGIRGQMPTLGFRSQMTMQIELKYWSSANHRYTTLPHSRHTISLGFARDGLHQSGLSYQFAPHAGSFVGTIRFDWRLTRRSASLGHVTRWTSGGHRDADGGDPRHHTASKCVIS